MKLTIKHQDSFSRGELLLRTFFGWLYIVLPHMFLLMFMSIWSGILTFIAWWSILFTGRYPQSFFEFQVGLIGWSTRVNARLYNLSDGYPSFGISGTDENTSFEMAYPEKLSRGLLLLKTFLGFFYVLLPHGFILIFRLIWTQILSFLAFWVILFTGKYPASWHEFNVGTLRWGIRVNLYMNFLSDDYPPFSGKEDDGQPAASAPAPTPTAPTPPAPAPVVPEPPSDPAPVEEVTPSEPASSEPEPEEPKAEEPVSSEPVPEEPKVEEPASSEPEAEEPKTEEPESGEPEPAEPKPDESAASSESDSSDDTVAGEKTEGDDDETKPAQ